MKIDFEKIASDILFGKVTENYIMDNFNVEYRKNKSVDDIKNAVKKALKNGNLKTEIELSFLSLYLGQVLKAKK